MADEDRLDILIRVSQEGATIANQVRSNINALRVQMQQLIALQAGQLRANAQQVGSLQQLVAGQRQAIASMNAMAAAQKNVQQTSAATGLGLKNLVSGLASAAAAFAGFQAFKNFTEAGLEFNATIENANLGIATLITAQTTLHDSNGVLLTGTKALGAAQELAAAQVTKLRIAGLQTVATTQDLIKAFQQAVGVSTRWGFSLDQSREFTIQMAQAAAALQLPMDQLNEEIRSLLQGTINPRNTRIATALHITNEQVKSAQESGKLFDFLNKRLEAFSIAGEATAKTFTGAMSNIKEALQQLSGEATKPLFDALKETGIAALEDIFDMKNARISDKFSGIIEVAQRIFGTLGELLAGALGAAVSGAKELSQWLDENKFLISDMAEGFRIVAGQVKGLVTDILQVVGFLVQGTTEIGTFNIILRAAALTVAGFRDGLKLIVAILGTIGGSILTLILKPFELLLKALGATAEFFDKDLAASLKGTAAGIHEFFFESSQGVKGLFKDFASGDTATQKVLKQFDEMGTAAKNTTRDVKEAGSALATITAPPPDLKVKQDPSKLAAAITAAAKAEYSRQARDLKIALDKNEISYQKYYDDLTKASQQSIDEQIRAQNILLNSAKTDDAKDAASLNIKQLSEERIQVVEDNAEKLREALKKLDDEVRTAQIQLLKDQGRFAEARALEVESEFKETQQRLLVNAKGQGAGIIASLFDIDNAKAKMQEFERQVKLITDELKTRQEDIQVQLEAHTITERQSQLALADAYQNAKNKLGEILPIMRQVATITQDPASLQAVHDLEIQMGQWGIAIDRARDELRKLKDGARDALQEGIAGLLDETAQGFQDWGERVKGVARQIVGSLRQIASQMLATLIIQQSLRLGKFIAGAFADGGPVVGKATGGYITGPGTGTSDSIPAWLSHGEYVINAKAVRTVGMDLLDEINAAGRAPGVRTRRVRGYAEGGLVTQTSNDSSVDSRLSVGLEDGLVLRHMESSAGQKVLVKFVANNRNVIRQALGV